MEKYKVLKKNQTFLNQIGIFLDHSTNLTCESSSFFFGYHVPISQTIGFIISAAFIFEYPNDIKPILRALKVCVAVTQCAGMFFGVRMKVIQMKASQDELQQIVDNVWDTNDASEEHRIYWECEQKCRKHSQWLSYFVIFHTSIYPISFAYALICIALGDNDTSKWPLGMTAAAFDQTRLWGWFLMWIMQLFVVSSYDRCMTTITSFFVSCCYYIHAMCDHCNVLINSVANSVECMRTEVKPQKIKKLRLQIVTQLCNAIKFQIKIYEIFHMLVDINSVAIFSLLPVNPVLMSLCMYDVEMASRNSDLSNLLMDIPAVFCGLFWPVFLCHFATHSTDRVSSIGNMFYNSNWFQYPTKLQKCSILIIARSQQPVYFTGLGLVNCSLEVFGKLCKTASSYYIMFRTLEER